LKKLKEVKFWNCSNPLKASLEWNRTENFKTTFIFWKRRKFA